MNPFKIGLTLAINVFFTLSFAQAGGDKVGGGGGAFVCRNSQNQVIDAKLVDLYEGSERYGLTLLNLQGNINDALDQIMVKIYRVYNQEAASTIDNEARRLSSEMINKPGITLSKTADFNLVVQPSSCVGGTIGFEQLAFYGPDGRLNVSQDIYDHLSLPGKVGLLLHEAIYKFARDKYNAPTSTESRRAVAYFFSNLALNQYPADAVRLRPNVSDFSYACDYWALDVQDGNYILNPINHGVAYGVTLEGAFSRVPHSTKYFSWWSLVCSQFRPIPKNGQSFFPFVQNPCLVPVTYNDCRKIK